MRILLGVIHLGIAGLVLFAAGLMTASGDETLGKMAIFVAILFAVGGVGWAMGRDVCLWLLVGANSVIGLVALWLCVIVVGRRTVAGDAVVSRSPSVNGQPAVQTLTATPRRAV